MHWDALAARSQNLMTNNVRALGIKIAASHAHAARNHQAYVTREVYKLFQDTPDDKNSALSKRRFLESPMEVPSSAPIIQL